MDSSKSVRIWSETFHCVPVPYRLLVMGSNKAEAITHWLHINPGLLPSCSSVFSNSYQFRHYISALMKPEKTFTKHPVRREKLLLSGSQAGQGKYPVRCSRGTSWPQPCGTQRWWGSPPGLCPQSESDQNNTDKSCSTPTVVKDVASQGA